MGVGRLELATRPLILAIDGRAARGANFGKHQPAELTVVARDRAREKVVEAIARTAREGDRLARLEERGRPVPELAGQYWTDRAVTADDLSVRFMTAPAVTWASGGVAVRYRPVDLLM
jgi:hypothetical protein